MPQAQFESAKLFLQGMGYKARQELYDLPINLFYTEAQNYIKKFKLLIRIVVTILDNIARSYSSYYYG